MNLDELLKRIDNDFDHHPPSNALVVQTHEDIRASFQFLAKEMVRITPISREQSLMLTKLEEAMFWANAAIARNQ